MLLSYFKRELKKNEVGVIIMYLILGKIQVKEKREVERYILDLFNTSCGRRWNP